MISNDTVFSVVRKTDNLNQMHLMYQKALGFELLAKFEDLDGYDGVVLGHKGYGYHLEFTNRPGTVPKEYQVSDSYLVFYIADTRKWEWTCRAMIDAGFKYVDARNPYWKRVGKTFEDPDGYRIVIQNREFELSS
ncbi:VOC family protein [Vibrio sp. JC009]|uniref:VOC family protein n=1 Tax=Vibrio sp. JC009 TaxID=2912314 RepID=UPI0023B0172D|nr:VOC family protein [Vibrio sp. JC009]WED23785.1 VOC family protein [Vibrio sp. JC009]